LQTRPRISGQVFSSTAVLAILSINEMALDDWSKLTTYGKSLRSPEQF